MATFGEFYDALFGAANADGEIYMDHWTRLVSSEMWEMARKDELTEHLVTCFAEDMHTSVQELLVGTSGVETYTSRMSNGREFLDQVTTVALQFCYDVSAITNQPLTASEGIITTQ